MMYFFKHQPAFVKVQVLHMALYIKVKRGFTFSIKKTLSEIGLFRVLFLTSIPTIVGAHSQNGFEHEFCCFLCEADKVLYLESLITVSC